MKNIIEEKPTDPLHGRTLYNTKFVDDSDIKNKIVLDIGCGFGWFELNALQREAAHITGTEISKEDLETARRYIKNDKIDFKAGSAINLPFNDQSFDTVVSWEVIEHIPKNTEDKMFKEINRVLKNGGIFYLSTPYNSFFSKIFDPAWWLIGHRHYSRNQLISLAENNGFRAEKVVVNGGWWEIIGINNLYIAKWIFRRRPFFEKFINKMQDAEYKKKKGFTGIFIKFKKNG